MSVQTFIPILKSDQPAYDWLPRFDPEKGVSIMSHWLQVEMVHPTVRAGCRQEYVKLEDYEALEKERQKCQLALEEEKRRRAEMGVKNSRLNTDLAELQAQVKRCPVTGQHVFDALYWQENELLVTRSENHLLKQQVEALTFTINTDADPRIKSLEREVAHLKAENRQSGKEKGILLTCLRSNKANIEHFCQQAGAAI